MNQYFTSLASKCLFMPSKWRFYGFDPIGSIINYTLKRHIVPGKYVIYLRISPPVLHSSLFHPTRKISCFAMLFNPPDKSQRLPHSVLKLPVTDWGGHCLRFLVVRISWLKYNHNRSQIQSHVYTSVVSSNIMFAKTMAKLQYGAKQPNVVALAR